MRPNNHAVQRGKGRVGAGVLLGATRAGQKPCVRAALFGPALAEDSVAHVADRRPYDENLHASNQQRHGFWVLRLQTKEA